MPKPSPRAPKRTTRERRTCWDCRRPYRAEVLHIGRRRYAAMHTCRFTLGRPW